MAKPRLDIKTAKNIYDLVLIAEKVLEDAGQKLQSDALRKKCFSASLSMGPNGPAEMQRIITQYVELYESPE